MVICNGDIASTMTLVPAHEPSGIPGQLNAKAAAGPSRAPNHARSYTENNVDLDIAEVYFLVMHFLSTGPCQRAFAQLSNEVLQYKLLPRRYHGMFSRRGKQADESDDGMSFPLSYSDILARNPSLQQDHLVKLLQQLLVQNRAFLGAFEFPHSRIPTAADIPTLLGTGSFSLFDSENSKTCKDVSGWTRQLRWPHWHADQVHGLMFRELGGGFARHKQAPSVRTPSYVIVKPTVLVDRIQIIKKLRGHRNAVYCAIFDGTGRYVITGSDDRLVKFWSAETGLCLRSCRGHEGDITDLAVSNRNKYVASASNDFVIRVWLLPSGVPVSVLRGHTASVTAISFSPRQGCEHLLLSSSDDGTCRIWDASDSTLHSRVYMPNPKDVNPAPKPTVPAPPSTVPGCNHILCCAFNADGSIFVTGSSDKIARVWDACKWNDDVTGRPNYEMDTLKGHENDVNYVQFSGCAAPRKSSPGDIIKEEYSARFRNSWFSHDSIVTCSRDGTAIIWIPQYFKSLAKVGRWQKAYHLRVPPPPMPPQPPRGNGPRQRLLPTPRGVNMIVWSLDNRFVLAAIMDHRICVWNAADGSLVHSLTGHDKPTYVLDVHPLNPRIAMSAGYDGRVIIWDIWEGCPIKVYETGEFNLVDGNFSPDGTSLVVSDEVGQIYIFGTGSKMSEKDVKYDQFYLGDFRPLVRDLQGNVLDVETQLAPHHRNLRDLLCDAGMIPYAEPYQTIFQQRRLANLGFEWQPPNVMLSIGTNDDVTYFPPEQPVAFQPPAAPSPERHVQQGQVSGGGNRWVEQPQEVEEAMDWEQEVVGLSEDTGSDYSASEESLSDEKEGEDYESLSEGESNSEEGSEASTHLRRSGRNKRKMVESGRISSRKRVRGRACTEYDTRKHKQSRGCKSKSSRNSASRANRVNTVSGQEPVSGRPQRQAARNALNLFSTFHSTAHDDDEEGNGDEQQSLTTERGLARQGERGPAAASEEPRPLRSLRRRLQEESEEESDQHDQKNHASTSQFEGENLGDCRRPRSQRPRKLVFKFRNPAGPLQGPVQSGRPAESKDGEGQKTDPVASSSRPLVASSSETAYPPEQSHKVFRKLIIKPPKPMGQGSGNSSRMLEKCSDEEENHAGGEGSDLPLSTTGSPILGTTMLPSTQEGLSHEEDEKWQWKKGKAGKGGYGSNSSRFGEIARNDEKEFGSLEVASQTNSEAYTSEQLQLHNQIKLAEGPISDERNLSHHVERKGKQHDVSGLGEQSIGEMHALPYHPCSNSSNLEQKVEGKHQEQEPGDHEFGDRELLIMSTGEQNSGPTKLGDCSDKPLQSEGEGKYNLSGMHSGSDLLREDQCQVQELPASPRGVNCIPHFDVVNKDQEVERHVQDEEKQLLSVANQDQINGRLTHAELSGILDDGTNLACKQPQYLFENLGHVAEVARIAREDDVSMDRKSYRKENADEHEYSQEQEESLQKPESDSDMDHNIDEENSHDEVYEDDASIHSPSTDALRESEDESVETGRQRMLRKRRKTLGELALSSLGQPQQSDVVDLHSRRKQTRARPAHQEYCPETQAWSDEMAGTSWSAPHVEAQNGKQHRNHKLRGKPRGRESHRNPSFQIREVSHSDGYPSGRNIERPLRIKLKCSENMRKKLDRSPEGNPGGRGKQTRLASRASQQEEKQGQHLQKQKAKAVEVKIGMARSAPRGGGRGSKHKARKIDSASWLLMSEVELGTHYTPQCGDEVAYVQQGHMEFIYKSNSNERGPWDKFKLLPVEYCRIIGVDYQIESEQGSTSCKLQLEFIDETSPAYGQEFEISLPELTDYPDFIVEKNRYDASMAKGWGPRDRCKVWWASADGEDKGRWWDGRIKSLKQNPKSRTLPGSPWEKYLVTYRESSEATAHSPWELFDNNCQIPGWTVPQIDEYVKEDLLKAISEVEDTYEDAGDQFGVKQLRTLVTHDHNFLNRVPLPLTLETIQERLEKYYYRSFEAVEHDIHLLESNAKLFSGAHSDLAKKMKQLGDVLLQSLQ